MFAYYHPSHRVAGRIEMYASIVGQRGAVMRFYEGDYAYEIEPVRDTATQVFTGWRYNIYRIRPDNKLLRSGNSETQDGAESAARRELESVIKAEEKSGTGDGRNAA